MGASGSHTLRLITWDSKPGAGSPVPGRLKPGRLGKENPMGRDAEKPGLPSEAWS